MSHLSFRFTIGALALVIAATTARAQAAEAKATASPYLVVWTGPMMSHDAAHDTTHAAPSNFLAVLDIDPTSASYGRVITTTPVGVPGGMAHHIEYSLSSRGSLFTNDFMTGRVSIFDLRSPPHPRVAATMDTVPGLRKPHTFARLPNGNVIVSFQFGDGSAEGDPGGIAEFDAGGKLLRASSSADAAFPGARIRTYGLEVLPAIDRAITTSSPMNDEVTADVIQLWRLSDLALLRTMAVPKVEGDSLQRYPFEIRVLPGGRTAMMHSYYCGFYHLTGLDTDTPRIELVHAMRNPTRIGCAVPTIVGRWAVVPIAYAHRIVTLDISDPTRPVEVSALPTDTTTFPHWSSADPLSDRLVITEQGDGDPRVMMIRLDPVTGKLSWDDRFRDADSPRPGISFTRASWPHGSAGAVMPHGAVFARRR